MWNHMKLIFMIKKRECPAIRSIWPWHLVHKYKHKLLHWQKKPFVQLILISLGDQMLACFELLTVSVRKPKHLEKYSDSWPIHSHLHCKGLNLRGKCTFCLHKQCSIYRYNLYRHTLSTEALNIRRARRSYRVCQYSAPGALCIPQYIDMTAASSLSRDWIQLINCVGSPSSRSSLICGDVHIVFPESFSHVVLST